MVGREQADGEAVKPAGQFATTHVPSPVTSMLLVMLLLVLVLQVVAGSTHLPLTVRKPSGQCCTQAPVPVDL